MYVKRVQIILELKDDFLLGSIINLQIGKEDVIASRTLDLEVPTQSFNHVVDRA